MFVWVVAADFATIAAETVWRSCESVTTSGQVTAGTITTGTTLFDTANDPTSEMHIGKLFAHSDINVDGNVTATAFYGDGSNLTGITVAAASVGTSATLETRIAGVSATMATSIGNSNTAIATLSATLATSISNYLPLAGGTVTGNVSFGDNDKAIFGTGSDLEIYHDGFRSVIKDPGEFRFMSNTLRLTNTGNNAYFTAFNGGAATIFHNGTAKLGTTSTGIDVTGTVTADGLTVDTNTLHVDSTNNWVGIGTSSPSRELEVTGSGNVYIKVAAPTANDSAGIELANTGGTWLIQNDDTSSESLAFKLGGSEKMRLESDADLHVDGNVVAYSTTISDKRLKKDIAPIDNALWRVSQLNGCTFTYLKDDRKSAGLIAQDLEKVLPSAVIENEAVFHGEEGETYKTVQYDQVTGLLVEAVKELTAKVEELENASTK